MFFLIFSSILLVSCTSNNKPIPRTSFLESQADPALSGDGKKIALIVNRNGKPSVQLKNLKTGKILSLLHLSKYQPHSSPSLSWNGRYLAVIGHMGKRKMVILEDRMKRRMHKLSIPQGLIPIRISLSPHARKLAIQSRYSDEDKLYIYDLSNTLEADSSFGLYR